MALKRLRIVTQHVGNSDQLHNKSHIKVLMSLGLCSGLKKMAI